MAHSTRFRSFVLLFISILAVSTAAILIRLVNDQVSALVIAAYRLGLSACLSALIYFGSRHGQAKPNKRQFIWMAFSGAFLAAHFAAWISSLEYISVSSSVILVTTTPLWVALLSPLVLKEKVPPGFYLGMLFALLGGVVIAFSGPCKLSGSGLACAGKMLDSSPETLRGMLLALAGAWMASGYMLIGRKIRAETDNSQYTLVVYAFAALIMILAAVFRGEKLFGYSPRVYILLLAMALIPQMLGHSILNYSLKSLPATVVSIALLGEPIGSTILAILFLKEIPSMLEVIGGILILVGITIAVLPAKKPNAA